MWNVAGLLACFGLIFYSWSYSIKEIVDILFANFWVILVIVITLFRLEAYFDKE